MNAPLPKAYKDGFKDFYGRDFIVTPDVLIPRPETEQIIDAILNLAGKPYLPSVKPSQNILPEQPKILEVGTGSGCIAITLKKELPFATIEATDISKKALKIAEKNAKKHNAEITFKTSNLLDNITSNPDLIVANLPYVDKTWDWLDLNSLSYEPELALFANNHGLELIEKLIVQAAEKHTKYLILESDPCQHQAIIDYAKNNNYTLKEIRGYILVLVSL